MPAVKLLKEVGIQKSVEFLSRYDFNIKEQFKNLSLALGSNSVSPLHIAACYSSIANGGYFERAKFVKQIIVHPKFAIVQKSNYFHSTAYKR